MLYIFIDHKLKFCNYAYVIIVTDLGIRTEKTDTITLLAILRNNKAVSNNLLLVLYYMLRKIITALKNNQLVELLKIKWMNKMTV